MRVVHFIRFGFYRQVNPKLLVVLRFYNYNPIRRDKNFVKHVLCILLLLVIFVIGAVGCSEDDKDVLQIPEISSQEGSISYKKSVTVQFNDERITELLARILVEDNKVDSKIIDEEKIYSITIEELRFEISPSYIFANEDTYQPNDADMIDLQWFLFNQFSNDISTMEIDENVAFNLEAFIHFHDLEKLDPLNKDIIKMALLDLNSARKLPEHYFGFIPYPFVEVELMGGILSFTYYSPEIVQVNLNERILDTVLINNGRVWNYINDHYKEVNEKKGLFLTEEIRVIDGDTDFIVTNEFKRVDSTLRLLHPMTKVDKMEESENKIILMLNGSEENVIEIYNNDYIMYKGEYFIKEGVFIELKYNLYAG